MKRIRTVFTILCLVLFFALSVQTPVYADGTTMIYLSEKELGIGDTLTMTVNGSEKSTITVRYNASVLNFSNCDASGFTTNGNAITFTGKSAKITFKAASEGTSNLIVASDTLTGASTSVNVGGASAAPAEETSDDSAEDTSSDNADTSEAADPAEDTAAEQPAEEAQPQTSGDFTFEGIAYVVSERYSESEMPAGFTKTSLEIHGKTYDEPVNDVMTLLYLKPEANTNGSGTFFVYDAANDVVSPMQLVGDVEHYVIIMQPETFLIEGMTDAEMPVGEQTFHAYQLGEANDFYFIYGLNENQTVDWYQYDAAQGTVQRVNAALIGAAGGSTAAGGDDTGSGDDTTGGGGTDGDKNSFVDTLMSKFSDVRLLLAVMIFALAVLIIIIIYMLVFHRNEEDDVFSDNDEEEEDNGINLIGSDSDGLLDVAEVSLEDDEASEVEDDKEEEPAPVKTKKASREKEEDDDDDDDVEESKPAKKRHLFFQKKRQDDIWSEPEEDSSSLFDNDDEYEKFFRRVRSNTNESSGSGQVDVIDLNEL